MRSCGDGDTTRAVSDGSVRSTRGPGVRRLRRNPDGMGLRHLDVMSNTSSSGTFL